MNFNGKITYYYEDYQSDVNYLCTYDLKTNKKEISELTKEFVESYRICNGIIYYTISRKENNGTIESMLYKAVAGRKPEIIDSIVSEVRYTKWEGKDVPRWTECKLYDSFNDGGLYYNKGGDFYFYDGKTTNLLIEKGISSRFPDLSSEYFSHNINNIIGYRSSAWNDMELGYNYYYNNSKYSSIIGGYYDYDGFFVGTKHYDGKIKGVSKEGNKVVYNKDKESYVLDINSGLSEKLNLQVLEVLYFDNDNILYVNDHSKDLVLNNEVIDYNITGKTSNYNIMCEHNEDLSRICYVTESGFCIYKDNQANVISSSWGHITNNGNAYYVRDNNLYLYIDGESKLISSNVDEVYDGEYDVPGYKILR